MNKDFTFLQREHALAEFDVLADKAFLPSRPVLLGKTLQGLKTGKFDFNAIEAGLMQNWLGSEGSSEWRAVTKTFTDYGAKFDGDLITYTSIPGLPVIITIIPKDALFFQRPDTLIYNYSVAHKDRNGHDVLIPEGWFLTPNPVREYLNALELETDSLLRNDTLIDLDLRRRDSMGKISKLV